MDHAKRRSSCAECQRLKLRCDKNVPCASCIRRGCSSICPKGTLQSSGRGKRSVMSDVPELTGTIAEMGERIRQLEQVLENSYDEEHKRHPILRAPSRHPEPSTPAQVAEVLGSFSINETGEAVYFGPTAGTEALLSIEGASASSSSAHERASFAFMTSSFPFASGRTPNWDPEQALERLFAHLPSEERAWGLCSTFYRNGCWTGIPIEQDEAAELLTSIYQHDWVDVDNPSTICLHKMAVLYFICALGTLVDLDLEPYSLEADHYFDLGCAALSVNSLFEHQTVVTVRALFLLTLYYAHGGRRFTMDGAWSTISLASSIAQSLGMHRASFGSKLPSREASRCRALFWEIYTIETVYGLSVGRPTGTFLSNVSCPFPPDEDLGNEPFVKFFPGYRQARWEWTKEVIVPIMESFLTVSKPSYETVLQLDSMLRRYIMRAPFDSFVASPDDGVPQTWIQQHIFPHLTNIMVMYIHTGSLLEAIQEKPVNPLESSYATSFLAGYRSASEIIKSNIKNFSTHPALFTRWWGVWKSLFSAGVVLGNVAARYPCSPVAPQAMVEFLAAVDLIEKGAVSSGRARGGLAILQRLREKAIAAYIEKTGHKLTPPPPTPMAIKAEDEDMMNIFAGYTRIVANKVLERGLEGRSSPASSSQTQTTDSPGLYTPPTPLPSLLEESTFKNNNRKSIQLELPRNPPPRSVSGYDPAFIEYFSGQLPLYEEMLSVPQLPQSMPFQDAGFFFTYPPNSGVPAAGAGAGHGELDWQTGQEFQWGQLLDTL
ncbi:hypothetical protein FB45DRAFT_180259 [Roridomyces roridus]|uniref:Zn(2)-C6 fungal-type domain-containing protein n=1 Tax=Roridomyces roridus TaxID=1738132 RepID=A0AAD7FZK1_9AGAR|nr:hypothetical protein FB45DRAFT_180259 [Roridomyces roridus]